MQTLAAEVMEGKLFPESRGDRLCVQMAELKFRFSDAADELPLALALRDLLREVLSNYSEKLCDAGQLLTDYLDGTAIVSTEVHSWQWTDSCDC